MISDHRGLTAAEVHARLTRYSYQQIRDAIHHLARTKRISQFGQFYPARWRV